MNINNIFVTQRTLRDPSQILRMIEIVDDGVLPPIILSENISGEILVEDGHHRLLAYWLSGRAKLYKNEYILVLKESNKRKFGRIVDLNERIRNERRS